ncbi:oxidoreductase [Gonapodya prolifera JEL478]|uniref:Oxidoreductase n=1 Tax=Gonapodya prolifera (strain JEL478) TaxID=1344416 RepID=A0A139ANC5_GONPJ|nr:oxidoreductase [Gonapodya prolifera JEL478]|eukprot:KXS18033.1 oxidoreductase [Gonapodya prolifera JEL478]
MPTILIIGASRGLGSSLVREYASRADHSVLATVRGSPPSSDSSTAGVRYIPGIDLSSKDAAAHLVTALAALDVTRVDVVLLVAGVFTKETLDAPDWDAEVAMYTIGCIAPVFLVTALSRAGVVGEGTKVVLITSEAGSVTLRHEMEGGENYAHHGSKAAENMVGRLLAMDLKHKGVAVVMVHPGFMRTEMTRGVGYDKYWDSGGAVEPSVAASHLADFVDKHVSMEISGEFWAPLGPKGIGTIDVTVGTDLPTPCRLPW